MPPVISVATADMMLFKTVQHQIREAYENVFGARPTFEVLASTASEATEAWSRSREAQVEQRLLVLDARLPRGASTAGDAEGEAALSVLEQIRKDDQTTPALVLTTRTNATPEIDAYCGPRSAAIAMPLHMLERREIVVAFLGMLRKPARKTWDTIEIEIRSDSATLHLGANGKLRTWGGKTPREYYPVPELAYSYEDYRVLNYQRGLLTVAPRWLRQWRQVGQQLFRDLILRSLGAGLFYHIEHAAGGLNGLAFRFHIKDPKLHNAPFEATVRIDDLSEADDSRFVLVHAPVARYMGAPILRSPEAVVSDGRPARMLFIRSQVGDADASGTPESLPVLDPSGPDGMKRVRNYTFRRLKNIDLEREFLKGLPGSKLEQLELLDLETDECRKDPSKALKDALGKSKCDIIHFAGHSPTAGGKTLLVLPSATFGEAYAVPVEEFAEYAAKAGARLVYLSSCQGGSAHSVVHLAQRGVPHVIGFRWDVQDHEAAEFARHFYTELLGKDKETTICSAFRSACNAAYSKLQQKDETPIWASPILIAQAENWVVQGLFGAVQGARGPAAIAA